MVVDLGEQRVGVLVDEVREVLRIDSTTITAPGPMVSGLAAAYISGIVTRPERTIIILNARKLLSSTERWPSPRSGARHERAVAHNPSGPVPGDRGPARRGAGGRPGGRQARHHRAVQAGGRRPERSGPDEGRHSRPGGALQAGNAAEPATPRSSPAPARQCTPTTWAPRRTSRRAGASSRSATTPAPSSRSTRRCRFRRAISRRSRSSVGPRCSTRTMTTPSVRSPAC